VWRHAPPLRSASRVHHATTNRHIASHHQPPISALRLLAREHKNDAPGGQFIQFRSRQGHISLTGPRPPATPKEEKFLVSSRFQGCCASSISGVVKWQNLLPVVLGASPTRCGTDPRDLSLPRPATRMSCSARAPVSYRPHPEYPRALRSRSNHPLSSRPSSTH